MTNKDIPTFNIIRHAGDLNKAENSLGFTAYRLESIFVIEYGRFIPCAPYSEHFIYEVPKKYKDVPSFLCTCGSAAIIAGMSGYKQDASPQGLMFMCLNHATFGLHATGKERWI